MAYQYRGTVRDTEPEDLLPDPSTPGPQRRPFDPAKCGTRAGFKQHARHDEDPCVRCVEANRAYQDAYNKARRAVTRRPLVLRPCGTNAAYARHITHGEDPCDPCTVAHAEYQRKNRIGPDGKTRLTVAPLNPDSCGEYKGYKAHIRRGQDPCDPCAAAQVEYFQDWKAKQQERRAA